MAADQGAEAGSGRVVEGAGQAGDGAAGDGDGYVGGAGGCADLVEQVSREVGDQVAEGVGEYYLAGDGVAVGSWDG